MSTLSKFYLRDAVNTVSGTLPSTAQTASTVVATVSGASTARFMGGVIGTAQVSQAQVIATTGLVWFRQYVSDLIAAQTFKRDGTFGVLGSGACQTSTAVRPYSWRFWVGVWRPSTGALVGTLYDGGGIIEFGSSGTAETAGAGATRNPAGADVVSADGDVLVVQLYDNTGASGGTHTLYYDGTTEASAASNASFVSFSVPVTMFGFDEGPGVSEVRAGVT